MISFYYTLYINFIYFFIMGKNDKKKQRFFGDKKVFMKNADLGKNMKGFFIFCDDKKDK